MINIYAIFIVFFVTCVKQETQLVISVRKFAYQRDISEHCRRRAIPSVFLSRHVHEANAHILHFSRLELPYSCFISVRTESANNIILVMQLVSDRSLITACRVQASQLLVYEMGETFGGYWGALPDAVLKQQPSKEPRYYTIKATYPKSTITADSEEAETETLRNTENQQLTSLLHTTENEDFITVELPLLNITANLVPGEAPPAKVTDIDETFDLLYDVTPKKGENYETSIIPLVQFSIQEEGPEDHGKWGGERRYHLDYVFGNFTPDARLFYSTRSITSTKKPFGRMKWNQHKRKQHMKKKTSLFLRKELSPYFKNINFNKNNRNPLKILNHTMNMISYTRKTLLRKPMSFLSSTTSHQIKQDKQETLQFVQDVMKILNASQNITDKIEAKDEPKNISVLFKEIANKQHNLSVYLQPELFVYNENSPKHQFDLKSRKISTSLLKSATQFNALTEISSQVTTRTILETLSYTKTDTDPLLEFQSKNMNNVYATSKSVSKINNGHFKQLDTDDNLNITLRIENRTNTKVTEVSQTLNKVISSLQTPTKKRGDSLTGTMVDHESWENVVQVVPVMAGFLNQSVIIDEIESVENVTESVNWNEITDLITNSNIQGFVRKKRFIQVIPIEEHRGRNLPNLTTRKKKIITEDPLSYLYDIHELEQLIELEDDEVHGHVALGYLGQYVGLPLFNACDYRESKARHVMVFNSSRIVVAISNFTMDRMTLVLTSARTLMSGETRCPGSYLECQVNGASVCIDSTSACDGVPNCGAYDIYDEDRQLCGATLELQLNVCLAALTFMAVLLTLLYSVHYWLKRCVPKVSGAFFIYTDGSENVLYLDSIMRSPNDVDDKNSKIMYRGLEGRNFSEDDLNTYIQVEQDKGFLKKWLFEFFSKLIFCKRKTIKQEGLEEKLEHRRVYSFTELELSKIKTQTKETSLQTGESLEKVYKQKLIKKDESKSRKPSQQNQFSKADISDINREMHRQSSHELEMLRFSKVSKSDSLGMKHKPKEPLQKDEVSGIEELELCNTEYDQGYRSVNSTSQASPEPKRVTTTYEIHSEKPQSSNQARKRLRFKERATTIPNNDDDELGISPIVRRRSVFLGTRGLWRGNTELETGQEDETQISPAPMDFMRFWGNNKISKKSKRKPRAN